MSKATKWSGLAIAIACLGGCHADLDTGEQIEALTSQTEDALQTAEDVGVLAFLNDQVNVYFELLDVVCAIRSDAAENIIAHREGPDGKQGTADDDLFGSLAELDGVPRVGPVTIDDLTLCAESFGYQPNKDDLALLNFLNDSPHTSFDRLDVDCGLYSNAAANLVDHHDGPDAIDGTADDNPFHSVAEVDGVPQVGEATLAQLRACAKQYGYAKKNQAPPAWLTMGAALEVAKECIVTFIKEDRMHRPDWHAQLSYATTWESALAAGIMDGINQFGDVNYCVDTELKDQGTYYTFFGKSAFMLWTDVHVDKATGECTYIYIEID